MPDLLDRIWQRHANPWSVWTRIATHPLLYVPLWNRSWKQGALAAVWFGLNPVLFPEPADTTSWPARAVLGEAAWLEDALDDLRAGGPALRQRLRDPDTLFHAAGLAVFMPTLYAAYRRRLGLTILGEAASLGLQLWSVHRMAKSFAN